MTQSNRSDTNFVTKRGNPLQICHQFSATNRKEIVKAGNSEISEGRRKTMGFTMDCHANYATEAPPSSAAAAASPVRRSAVTVC